MAKMPPYPSKKPLPANTSDIHVPTAKENILMFAVLITVVTLVMLAANAWEARHPTVPVANCVTGK